MGNQPVEGTPVLRLTEDAWSALRGIANTRPEVYLDPSTDFGGLLEEKGLVKYAVPTDFHAESAIQLTAPGPSVPPHQGDRQALDFYTSLAGLTPRSASDPMMWAWMAHFPLHSYGIQRWRTNSGRGTSKHAVSHWFADGARSLNRYNTASRLWWLAHMCLEMAKKSAGVFDAAQALEHLSEHPRHYHNMLDNQFSRNPTIGAEFLWCLMNDAKGVSGRGSDAIWKRLNMVSGTVLLDALPRPALRELLGKVTEDVMSNPDNVRDREQLRNRKAVKVLSLGAGVQSSCLALMAERGEYGLSKPDFAIFADTGWEPPAVYEHLEWLKEELSYEVVTVSSRQHLGRSAGGTHV